MERGHHHKQEDADHHRNQPSSDRSANASLSKLVPGMWLRSGCGRARGGTCIERVDAARASGVRRDREVALLRVTPGSAFDLLGFVDEIDASGK